MRYLPSRIEKKWQRKWLREGIYEPDLKRARRPFYNLMMFPYPSAEGLHVGNMYAFTGTDIYGRFKRMQGYDVFEPIGLDGFGIHSENYALKIRKHPAVQAKVSEKNFYRQLEILGNGFAWREGLKTYDPDYYKWTQWIFIQMFKRGLAYRKKARVNWCPSCKTVLADEQVVAGKCERCGTEAIKKELEQWFFRITKYAERLLKNLEKIDWSERVKIAQRNWIGKSEGAEITFPIVIASGQRPRGNLTGLLRFARNDGEIKVFTTRPDTLFGATYMVLAPEHLLIRKLGARIKNYEEVRRYIQKAKAKSDQDRIAEGREKTGVELKGIRAVNPANQEEIPIWVADYVLGHVGTGAIMAVPAHDQRDFEFARRYHLPIRTVIVPSRTNCIVVHGCPRRKEDTMDLQKETTKHWIPWLRKKLESNGAKVFVPQMPEPWQPVYAAWKREFEKLPVGDNSILIGHSCGGAFLVRWLGETKRRVRKLILVAPAKIPAEDVDLKRKKFYEFEIDGGIRERVGEVLIFTSDTEKERHRKSARLYTDTLGGTLRELKNRGHYTFKQMGTREFPELLEAVLAMGQSFMGEGILINSDQFTGQSSKKAKWGITKFVAGKRKIQYRLRDWLISRQRYWGPPIPLVFCEHCAERIKTFRTSLRARATRGRGSPSRLLRFARNDEWSIGELKNPGWIAVPEKDLPVKLPFVKNFRPTGTSESPLASVPSFYKVRCPKCKSWARRETDVSDTFLDSAWYYLRYPSVVEKKQAWNPAITGKWLPVHSYIGGAEHSVLHLLYSRFVAMAFHDWGLLHFEEPFTRFRAHGLLISQGAKMSKSKGNIVNPDDYIRAYGADALRMYLMFLGPFEQGGDFRDTGIKGITRFLERVWKLISNSQFLISKQPPNPKSQALERLVHRTIKKVGEDIENLRYNTAISALMVLLNEFEKSAEAVSQEQVSIFLRLLAPFAPHLTEELWQRGIARGTKAFRCIHVEPWPAYDSSRVEAKTFPLVIQVDGKTRDRMEVWRGISQTEAVRQAQARGAVKRHLAGRRARKIVYVPDRLVNFVL